MTGDWISMQGSLGHYSSGTGARISGADECVRPHTSPRDECVRLTSYLRAKRRILEVKALPWQAAKVGAK
jgi:hypothetical protein